MGNLTTAFVFVLSINLIMFLAQASVDHLSPESSFDLYNTQGGIIDEYVNTKDIDTINPADGLPETGVGVDENTGSTFLDPIGTIKKWFIKTLGLVYNVVKAPFNFLDAIFPEEADDYVQAIGWFWYIISLAVVIVFILRGND